MPVEKQPPTKRRRLPFNPPRPRASPGAGPSTSSKPTSRTTKKNTTTTTASSSKQRNSAKTQDQPSQSPSPSRSPSASPRPFNSPSQTNTHDASGSSSEGEPEYILAEITTQNHNTETDILNSEPTVPPKLLTRLLHHHFQNPKTKIAKDANEVVAKYVDVFVRESLARAAFERKESGNGGNGGVGIGDGFLEVEDLEKMAPQLVLDF